MINYSYGNYYTKISDAYSGNFPATKKNDTGDNLQIKLPGTNKKINFYPIPLGFQTEDKCTICYMEGTLGELNHSFDEKPISIRCLFKAGDLSHVEFLFQNDSGKWMLGAYDENLEAFVYRTDYPYKNGYTSINYKGEKNAMGDKYVQPTKQALQNIVKHITARTRAIIIVTSIVLALLCASIGSTMLFLKLGGALSSAHFYYLAGSLLGAALIAIVIAGVAHWKRRAQNSVFRSFN